jgi:UDP-GlcNAc:undecaprenyl-phosphate GlcNAc-1-phosphate transferase
MTYLIAFPLALISSLLLTPLARAVAVRRSLLDVPDGVRFHRSPIPLLGGVAVLGALLLSGVISHFALGLRPNVAHLLLGAGLLLSFLLGVYDDRRGMGARWKIGGQTVCAALLVVGCYRGGWIEGAYLFPLLVLWVVGVMNAINFLDNMDGIAGGVAAITSLAFLPILFTQQHWTGVVVSAALCGASLGFLRSNFPPASIFLGDAGSLPLGYLLGALSVMTAGSDIPGSFLIPVVVLAYPVFDITFVTLVRLKEGRRFYQGGRDHSSHRFAALWASPRKTALVIYLFCVVLGLLAILMERIRYAGFSASVVAVVFLFFLFLGLRLQKVRTDSAA